MDTDDERSRPDAAFFGRRHGRTLRPKPAHSLRTALPRYLLEIAAPTPADLRKLFPLPVKTVCLEIGFGGGEHLLHRATADASTGFIGVEPFVNGMAGLMTALAARPLGNLRVYDDDATSLLDWLPEGSLGGIDLLYPDPWPKRRHWKRRFVNPANLDRFARVLAPGAVFRFASDIDDYVNWTLDHCARHGAFEWRARRADDWRRPFQGWPGTRYEAKALAEGRRPAYLAFGRR